MGAIMRPTRSAFFRLVGARVLFTQKTSHRKVRKEGSIRAVESLSFPDEQYECVFWPECFHIVDAGNLASKIDQERGIRGMQGPPVPSVAEHWVETEGGGVGEIRDVEGREEGEGRPCFVEGYGRCEEA